MIIEPTIKANAGIRPFKNEDIDSLIQKKQELNKTEKPTEKEFIEEEEKEQEVVVKKNNKSRGGK